MLQDLIQSALVPRERTLSGKTVLVTGASSGIGLATAVRLALEGCHLKLLARRQDRLNELKNALIGLNPKIRIELYPYDLTSADSMTELKEKNVFDVEILINNAGLASGLASVIDSDEADWQRMISTNVNAAFSISKNVAECMANREGGDIVALSSVAAHDSYEKGAVYCASKHALKAFHQALILETLERNIRVMMISPGMVETEFSNIRFNGDEVRAKAVYRGVNPLSAGDIAHNIVFMLKQPIHVNIDDLVIKPQQQGNPWRIHRAL